MNTTTKPAPTMIPAPHVSGYISAPTAAVADALARAHARHANDERDRDAAIRLARANIAHVTPRTAQTTTPTPRTAGNIDHAAVIVAPGEVTAISRDALARYKAARHRARQTLDEYNAAARAAVDAIASLAGAVHAEATAMLQSPTKPAPVSVKATSDHARDLQSRAIMKRDAMNIAAAALDAAARALQTPTTTQTAAVLQTSNGIMYTHGSRTEYTPSHEQLVRARADITRARDEYTRAQTALHNAIYAAIHTPIDRPIPYTPADVEQRRQAAHARWAAGRATAIAAAPARQAAEEQWRQERAEERAARIDANRADRRPSTIARRAAYSCARTAYVNAISTEAENQLRDLMQGIYSSEPNMDAEDLLQTAAAAVWSSEQCWDNDYTDPTKEYDPDRAFKSACKSCNHVIYASREGRAIRSLDDPEVAEVAALIPDATADMLQIITDPDPDPDGKSDPLLKVFLQWCWSHLSRNQKNVTTATATPSERDIAATAAALGVTPQAVYATLARITEKECKEYMNLEPAARATFARFVYLDKVLDYLTGDNVTCHISTGATAHATPHATTLRDRHGNEITVITREYHD